MENVLIIDDSIGNIKMLSSILENEYNITVTKNGIDGINKLKQVQPSLILLDVLMPEMDGFEVLARLKEDKKTKNIPVIFITCLSDDKNEERGLSLGAVDYIVKPFNANVIRARVKNHIQLFLYQRTIENLAMLDGLTGIPNRRNYDQRMEAEWGKAIRRQTPLSLAIFDIDCFKEYNDNYGHLQGDDVLKRVATVLNSILIKENCYLARYGGEEFVALFKNTSQEKAIRITEELRIAVESLAIPHFHSRAAKTVTISAGGKTIIPKWDDDLHRFVNSVDERLYIAKGLGRNQIVWEDKEEQRELIAVSMFDHFSVSTKNGSISTTANPNRKLWTLLEFLIINRHKDYTKKDLLEAIWPTFETMDPSFELKRLFSDLKVALEQLKVSYSRDLVVLINGTYHWNNNYICCVDCETFEALCEKASDRNVANPQKIEIYEKALNLYKGHFLEVLGGAQWVIPFQSYYHEIYLDALHHLLELIRKSKQYDVLKSICEKNIEREKFDEELQYNYLLVLIKDGKQKEALDHYEYMTKLFYRSLGMKPSKRIINLYPDIVNTVKLVEKDLNTISRDMKETDVSKGAYYCDYRVFVNIYQIEARSMIRSGKMVYLCLLRLSDDDGNLLLIQDLELIMPKLLEVSKKCLRMGDIISRFGISQYVILLPNVNYDTGNIVMQRIKDTFYKKINNNKIHLRFELSPVEPVDANDEID